MTAQIDDTCFHRKIEFSVAGVSGSGLFDPADLGVDPHATSTACWRGYVAHYSILEGRLFLTSLHIGFENYRAIQEGTEPAPELFGVLPTSECPGAGFLYEGFQSPVSFTGGLLLAHEFIRELYVHMGFHTAWKYRRVQEVVFDAGRMIEDHDLSDEMAMIRAKALQSPLRPDIENRDEVEAWIKNCFSRDY